MRKPLTVGSLISGRSTQALPSTAAHDPVPSSRLGRMSPDRSFLAASPPRDKVAAVQVKQREQVFSIRVVPCHNLLQAALDQGLSLPTSAGRELAENAASSY